MAHYSIHHAFYLLAGVETPILDALRHYGDHAKAAYVLFEKWKQGTAVKGDVLHNVVMT